MDIRQVLRSQFDAALDMLAMNRAMLAEWLRQRTLDTARR